MTVRCVVCHRKVWRKPTFVVEEHHTPTGEWCPMSGNLLPEEALP